MPEKKNMTLALALALLLAGVAIGVLSGLVGIGGGLLVVPMLIIFFGFTQQQAAGTSLAMLLPPIGIFAVIACAKAGNVNWTYAAILAAGFTIGGYIGARIMNAEIIPPTVLRVGFALFLVFVAANLLFRSGGRARAALETTALVGSFLAAWLVFRFLGRIFLRHPRWNQAYRDRLKRGVPREFDI
jgi:uncharacterized membrane protein YfcA